MTRYFTPFRIGLICLIEVYTDGVVSPDSMIPILSFIIQHVLPPSSSFSSASPTLHHPISHFSALLAAHPSAAGLPGRSLLDLFLAKLWAIDSLHALHHFFERRAFLLAPASASADANPSSDADADAASSAAATSHQLRASLLFEPDLGVAPPPESGATGTGTGTGVGELAVLSRSSPCGAFVRRARLEFARLRFDEAAALWRALAEWRESTREVWWRRWGARRRKREAHGGDADGGEWCFDEVLRRGGAFAVERGGREDEAVVVGKEWSSEERERLAGVAYGFGKGERGGGGGSWEGREGEEEGEGRWSSTDDVERLLEFQVEQMQKFGSRITTSVKDQFESILSSNVMIPSLSHYVSFLDAWRAGDYSTSFDSLHRFFDYTMQNRDRLFYQYALLNLAVLQADFGCFEEAVAAMQETVATARENKDMSCLNFSLSWLYHFSRAHPRVIARTASSDVLGVERESLAFLRARARESGMWSLWSSTLLSEAKAALCAGESVAGALENLVRSSELAVAKNMLAATAGPQAAVRAALWSRLGVACLAASSCEVFLRCHASPRSAAAAAAAPFDDTLRVACRAAQLLALRGRHREAVARLDALDPNALRSLAARRHWARFRGMLRLRRDLCRGNLAAAAQLLAQLLPNGGNIVASSRSNNNGYNNNNHNHNHDDDDTDDDNIDDDDDDDVDGADGELVFELHLLHVEHLTRRGDLSGALAHVDALAARLHPGDSTGSESGGGGGGPSGGDILQRVELLTLKAQLHARSGRPQRGFSAALRAATAAWRARLLPALWRAAGALAHVLTALGEFAAAAQVLAAVLPRALECEDCALAAGLYALLADAHMGLAGAAAAAKEGEEKKREREGEREREKGLKAKTTTTAATVGRRGMQLNVAKVLDCIDRAFGEYSSIEDVDGQCEMMVKKATVMRTVGDMKLADDYAAVYLDLKRRAAEEYN